MALELDSVTCMDALEFLKGLRDASVDLVLSDLPYGTIACAWDTVIPFEPLWVQLKRIIKPQSAIVLTASQPFTAALVMSNPKWFRCEWIWRKTQGRGYLNANRQPMKNHESVLVFAAGEHGYYPQKRKGAAYSVTNGAVGGFIRDKTVGGYLTVNEGDRYPLSVLDFNSDTGLHPTQKPLALFEYLIRTYSRESDLVVDMTCGSGTTALAARKTGRRYAVNDNSAEYIAITRDRLRQPFEPLQVQSANDVSDLPLFATEAQP